jgi:anti-sigma factor RsiW
VTTEKTTCDPTTLSRFFDEELGPDDHARTDKHLKHCPACRRILRGDQSIRAVFKDGLAEELSHAHVEELEERVLDLIRSKGLPWWTKPRAFFASKRFYVPAAAMATALILFFSVVRDPASEPGPSAIIKSFTGEISSVMIIETPKSQQTILWFNETLIPGDEDDEIQET